MKATADNTTIGLDVLIDYLNTMYTKNIGLDAKAFEQLSNGKFNSPQEFANFCFQQGWKQSVKHVLEIVRPREYEKN